MRPTGQNEWDKRMRRMWFLRCRDRHVFIYRHTQYTLTCISRWSLMICKQIRKEFHFRPSRACSHSVCGIVLGASKNKVRLFWYWCDLDRCFFFYFILIHCYCVCVFEWPSIPSQSFQSLNHLQITFGIIYIAGSWQTVEHAESISSDNCIYHPSRLHSTAAPSHESEVMKKKTKQNGIVRATSTIYSWLCLVYGASSCFACLAELANTHTQTHTSSTLNMWTMNTSALARMPQTGVCMKLKEEEVEKKCRHSRAIYLIRSCWLTVVPFHSNEMHNVFFFFFFFLFRTDREALLAPPIYIYSSPIRSFGRSLYFSVHLGEIIATRQNVNNVERYDKLPTIRRLINEHRMNDVTCMAVFVCSSVHWW